MAEHIPDLSGGDDDPIPEFDKDEMVVMRLGQDEAVVSVHVRHPLNDEEWEQELGKHTELPDLNDHALFAALQVLWEYHRDSGYDAKNLMIELEKDAK